MKSVKQLTRPRRRGNALIETALVLALVLLPLTFWTMDLTYYFFVRSNLQAAAREGARVAIVPGATTADIDAAVTRMMNSAGLPKTKSNWSRTLRNLTTGQTISSLSSLGSGDSVEVKVSCTWGNVQLTPSYLNLIPSGTVVGGQTAMRME